MLYNKMKEARTDSRRSANNLAHCKWIHNNTSSSSRSPCQKQMTSFIEGEEGCIILAKPYNSGVIEHKISPPTRIKELPIIRLFLAPLQKLGGSKCQLLLLGRIALA